MPTWILLIIAGIITVSMNNYIQTTNEVANQEYIVQTKTEKVENKVNEVKEKIEEKEEGIIEFIREQFERAKELILKFVTDT